MVDQEKVPASSTEESEMYLVGMVKQPELQEWLNERVRQGYTMDTIWMVPRSSHSESPEFAVLMRLVDI